MNLLAADPLNRDPADRPARKPKSVPPPRPLPDLTGLDVGRVRSVVASIALLMMDDFGATAYENAAIECAHDEDNSFENAKLAKEKAQRQVSGAFVRAMERVLPVAPPTL